MVNEILLDFETASPIDLKKAGAFHYAENVNTEILCLSYSVNNGPEKTWYPDDPIEELKQLANDPQVMWIAHNAQFEKAIWRNIMVLIWGLPDIPNSRWHDTMASCAMRCIPLKLENAVKMLNLPIEKDMEGSRFTIGLSRLNKRGYYDRSPEAMARTAKYCEQDVRAEKGIHKRLGYLPPSERNIWLLDQRINERGVCLDMRFVKQAQQVVDRAAKPLLEEFRKITGGLKPTQVKEVVKWSIRNGGAIPNLKKETLVALLGAPEDEDDAEQNFYRRSLTLPPMVHRALEIRQLLGSSSVKKLKRMETCICDDGRARGLLQYHGAGPGRWAGRLFQPQNFPTGTINYTHTSIEQVIEAILTGEAEYVRDHVCEPIRAVASSLRHAIFASPGRTLNAGDFSGIEARIVLAMAGQHDKTALMASGRDVYCDLAEIIYKKKVDKFTDNGIARKIGKAGVLGSGFQMWWPKFQAQVKQKSNIDLSDDEAKTAILAYRKQWAPLVPKVWYALEDAAAKAVHTRKPKEAYGVQYQLEDGWLTARIPSGRKLWYWNPQPTRKAMAWDETDIRLAWTYEVQKGNGQKRLVDAYGGLLTENVVQALARDIMVAAMFKCEKNNMPVILTVHDEIVTEPENKYADPIALNQIMCDIPAWATALQIPITAECWTGERYKK